ncbi:MAG: hypothetical protein KDK89_07925 [Alphaproteobacteria bacterium]|nr:hypothetical protein [Alphaproteobacteria bacterium]
MLMSMPVHMLWVGGPLSRLARLSLTSFLSLGYHVKLWSYEPDDTGGAELRDAAEILPVDGDPRANMAWLTSLFRYRLLAEHGGIWSDMDVVALRSASDLPARAMVASEKRRPFRHREASATGAGLTQVTNCFMANPLPASGDLWHRATDAVALLNREDRTWENVGPHLLSRLMLEDPGHGVTILSPDVVDPVAWWNVPGIFLEDHDPPPSPFMHMYATVWARRGVNADAPFPDNSMAERLWRRFGL